MLCSVVQAKGREGVGSANPPTGVLKEGLEQQNAKAESPHAPERAALLPLRLRPSMWALE
jgi:hypothetical protein